jgi:predicted amidophosphoribosyltransferase
LGHGKLLVVRAILNLPTQCAVCLGWSPRRVCADCVNRHAAIKPRCVGCAIGLPSGVQRCGACITAPLPFALVVAAVDLSDGLAQLLADAVRNSGAALPPLVLPVPLGRVRQAERGMNQAWELARRVAARLHLRAQAGLLARRVETPHLADLPRDERARAICGAFALAPGATTTLHGQHVALVDDVMTTGATAAEAARALLGGGAASVQMWVFARTP